MRLLAHTQDHVLPYCCARSTLLPPPALTQMSPSTQSTLPNGPLLQDLKALIPGPVNVLPDLAKETVLCKAGLLRWKDYSG